MTVMDLSRIHEYINHYGVLQEKCADRLSVIAHCHNRTSLPFNSFTRFSELLNFYDHLIERIEVAVNAIHSEKNLNDEIGYAKTIKYDMLLQTYQAAFDHLNKLYPSTVSSHNAATSKLTSDELDRVDALKSDIEEHYHTIRAELHDILRNGKVYYTPPYKVHDTFDTAFNKFQKSSAENEGGTDENWEQVDEDDDDDDDICDLYEDEITPPKTNI